MLSTVAFGAAQGGNRAALVGRARADLSEAGLETDYVDIVDPETFLASEPLREPLLAVAAVRLGSTRLIDNRWVCGPSAFEGCPR